MQLINKIKTDRSGKISTILLVVIVIIIVVIVAVALYIVLSGDNNKEQELAPGTVLDFDINGVATVDSLKMEFVGQNADEYFVKTTTGVITTTATGTTTTNTIQYTLMPKYSSDNDTQFKGIEEIETANYGKLKLNVYSMVTDDVTAKIYADTKNNIPYRMVYTYPTYTMTAELKDYEVTVQDKGSYKESDTIGTTSTYSGTAGSFTTVCVADCINGQFGLKYGNTDVYFLCNGPQGLPVGAFDTGSTIALTVEGNDVDAEVWALTNMAVGYDPESKMVYTVGIVISATTSIILYLSEVTDKAGTTEHYNVDQRAT